MSLRFFIGWSRKGEKGDQGTQGNAGVQGTPGAAATITVGSVTTGAAGSSVTVVNSGSSAAALLNFQIPKGDMGATGATGATGPAGPTLAPTQSAVTRALNTIFQVSATQNAFVFYSVQITVTASITGGQNGDVILEIASNAGFTTNVQTLSISGVGQAYTLAIALQGVQPQTNPVSGLIPAGYYARLRTVNNTGTPAFSYRAGQEVLL